jgi:hypothetical protein
MLTLVTLALATSNGDAALEPACPPTSLLGSIPSDGATDVAADAPILLHYDGGQCGESIQWSLDGPQGFVASDALLPTEWLNGGLLFRVDLPLEPDTAYVLTLTPDVNGEPIELAFATGADPFEAPLLDTLTVAMEVIDVFEPQAGILDALSDVTVDGAAPGTLVRLSTTESAANAIVWMSDGQPTIHTVSQRTEADEACYYARAEDVLGNAGDWVQACEAIEAPVPIDEDDEDLEPYKPSRCQSAPAPASLVILVPLLLGMRRRAHTF